MCVCTKFHIKMWADSFFYSLSNQLIAFLHNVKIMDPLLFTIHCVFNLRLKFAYNILLEIENCPLQPELLLNLTLS